MMPSFRYRLIDSDGSDLGPFVASHAHWQPGGLIPHADGYLRIVAVVEPLTDEAFQAYLVVEKLGALSAE
jgi:hypothetical protein